MENKEVVDQEVEATPAPKDDLTDAGVREFMVGGKPVTLKFLAATRFRLFINIEPNQVQQYVSSEAFKLRAVGLLLLGKKALSLKVDEILDEFEELQLDDDECQEIYEWVLKRTINFMLREAESQSQAIQAGLPQIEQLSNSLNGLNLSALKKPSA